MLYQYNYPTSCTAFTVQYTLPHCCFEKLLLWRQVKILVHWPFFLFSGSYTAYLLYYVDIPTIMNKADKNIEQITNYNEITDYYGDTYDLTVHELNHVKEIRYYDKIYGRSKLFNVISAGQDTTYYYRIKPDLSYERVPLKETSFDKDKE